MMTRDGDRQISGRRRVSNWHTECFLRGVHNILGEQQCAEEQQPR